MFVDYSVQRSQQGLHICTCLTALPLLFFGGGGVRSCFLADCDEMIDTTLTHAQ